MKKKQLHQPFELYVSDMEDWNERALIYQFFEIVQIMEGEGTRIVNESRLPYSKGSIFLFTPLDCRGFESSTPTRFCSIRFSEIFLSNTKVREEKERIIYWLCQLENIFTQHNRFEKVLIKSDSDCKMIFAIIENMMTEYLGKQSYYDENLQHLVTVVLNIIARNVSHTGFAVSDTKFNEPLINKILVYLRTNIHCPEKLKIKNLAAQFHLSVNYIGEYFKKLTGESLQCYITQYKMNVIRQRLGFSAYSIAQIANEFGYADESHFNRQFKKQNGITPAEYRRHHKK